MKHSQKQRIGMLAWLALVVVSCCLPSAAFAANTNSTSTTVSLQNFKIITQRNIFDPNRRAGSGERGRRIDPNRLARADGFSLVGTLIDKRGEFAFFSGSDPKYKKVLKVAGTIADYKVTEVAPDYVELETNGNQIKMCVGMQMKKLDAGEWQLVDGTVALAKVSDTSASETKDTDTSEDAPSTGSSSADAVLKRLMQQREKELNK
jgi:hypothetical protein